MVRTRQWVKLIQMANESGLSRRDWCEKNGISMNTFYYWQRKLRGLALGKTMNDSLSEFSQGPDSIPKQDFFEISVPEPVSPAPFCGQPGSSIPDRSSSGPSGSGLSIRSGAWTLDIAENFSRQALRSVLEVMRDVQHTS